MNIPKIRVSNMESPRSGRPVANQFEISINSVGTYFQSYNTIIAVKTLNGVMLDANSWNYSRTTSKYRSQFLGESTKETEAKIKSGEYKLEELN